MQSLVSLFNQMHDHYQMCYLSLYILRCNMKTSRHFNFCLIRIQFSDVGILRSEFKLHGRTWFETHSVVLPVTTFLANCNSVDVFNIRTFIQFYLHYICLVFILGWSACVVLMNFQPVRVIIPSQKLRSQTFWFCAFRWHFTLAWQIKIRLRSIKGHLLMLDSPKPFQ